MSGDATFDLTQQGLDAPLNLVGGLWTTAGDTATVTVSGGAGKMYFGGANTGINFVPFNTDVAFSSVENPEGVTFRNYSTVIFWPASCPWSIADNATVALYGTNMLSAGDVFLTNYNIYVLSPYAVATGATIHVQGTNRTVFVKPGTIPVSGNLTVTMLGGSGKLVKQGDDTLNVYFSTNTTGVQVDAGTLTLAPPSTNTVLGNLPALWLDASASGVFTQYKSYVFTNGFINIERWNDCRPGAPYYGYNNRGNDNQQVYPYVATNCLNGLPVVSMGSFQLTLTDPYIGPEGGGIEARRLPLSTNLYPQYALMVYGSPLGGGTAMLGGNTAFYRAGSSATDYRNPATPMFSSSSADYPVWTNGVSVVATNTGFNGGYQILSVNTKGQLVNALGWRTDPGNAGGQNYAEVLFYTNALTTLQRLTAEAYLAKKWGLPFAYTCELSNATVAAGATLEVGGMFSVARIDGAGAVVADSGAAIRPSGYFTGTIALNGGALTLSSPLPPQASDISTEGLSCWFDPTLTNRVVFGGTFTPSRPLAVAALYDRTTTNRYLFGSCSPTDMNYDRRPWLSATNGPNGETQYWLDYSNVYGDSNGNTLRLYRNPAYIGTSTTGQHTPTNVQTGFIVLDSSRGGGVPITYDVSASSVFTRDNPQSVSSPIWGASSAGAVKNAQTFLNGVAVNGATRGYSGTTELLSFVTTNVVQAAFFGFYGGDGATGNLNRERLGEILLFDTALTNTVRADIEAYLMKKWLGKAREGYGDFTAATVTGGGTVTASGIRQLPVLDAAFTGDVVLTDSTLAFSVSTNDVGQYVVSPSLAAPAALTVPAAGTVSVNFLARSAAGIYTLLSYGAASGTGFADWTLATSGDLPRGPVRLQETATALNIVVVPQGTMIRLF